jgi:hypothetical protein
MVKKGRSERSDASPFLTNTIYHAVVKSVPRTFQQTSRVWRMKCLEHWANEKVGYILSQLEFVLKYVLK